MRFNVFRTFRRFLTIHRITILNYKRFFLSDVRQNILRNIAISCGTASVSSIIPEITENTGTKEQAGSADLGFLNEVRKACIRNDDALKELMDVLSECLIEISKEYQANIDKQIEIIKKCTTLGPIGEHWDELTRFRIQGTELREELTKYEVLVQKVGQMAYNQAVTSLLSGIEDAMDLLEVHYSKLEKTVTKLAKDNYYWETKLLYANRDSILHGLKMSSQKGNNSRSRPQKYQNITKFKNTLHDTSHKTKFYNNMCVSEVCERCKEIIEWKIKYKKYKPLSQPRKCVKCDQKTVKKAYHVMCSECGKKNGVCTKCCEAKDIIPTVPDKEEEIKLDNELQKLLQSLPERKRRTVIRYMNKKDKNITEESEKNKQDDFLEKLKELQVNCEDTDKFDSDFTDSDES